MGPALIAELSLAFPELKQNWALVSIKQPMQDMCLQKEMQPCSQCAHEIRECGRKVPKG